ncbi:MAG: hypothetical protein HYU55_04355 [Nocardioides sp.]|nr:hypothetical protein [Nocardioides sp.]
MLRPLSLLPALTAVASLAAFLLMPAGPAQAQAPAARRVAATAPLAMTIDSLTPSEIPRHGPVRVTGTVTNQDTETWTTVNVYAFVSDTPMTTSAELADAAETAADSQVGERIIEESAPGTQDTIDQLAPNATERFSLTIPRRYLPSTTPGVYWFGVHALGQGPAGRDETADGRARTFLPLAPPARGRAAQKAVQAALVVPIRRQIEHAADGSVGGVESWVEALGTGGTLRSLVDLGVAAGSRPITWLLDPAVPDAVRQLVAGNPPRSLGPTVAEGDEGSESPDATPSPTDGTEPDGTGSSDPAGADSSGEDSGGEEPAPELAPEVQQAADLGSTWLEALHDGLEGHEILTLPYGDVDVAAAAKYDPATYRAARKRSTGDLAPWGLPTTPAVSSPAGYLDAGGIRLAEPASTVLVTDRMLGPRAPSVVRTEGHTLAVSSSGAASGGPGPTDRMTPLALRQRIVSEAAVRLLTRGRKPLVVTLPTTWSAPSADGFFEGLDLDWLNLTDLTTITQRAGTAVPIDRLRYPDGQDRLELDADVFTAAGDLIQAGDSLQNLLTNNDEVGSTVRDEAFTDVSYSDRLRPVTARTSADQSRAWIESRLRGVRIDAPKAVILSSGSGRFAATITNSLDQPVSVRVRAVADPPLEVAVPTDTIDIGPDNRATVLLNASSSAVGIRNVTLLLTDVDNVPLGSSDDLPIRSNRVSSVIWLIIGTGIALLFGAIAVRLVRRVRAARRS